MVTGGTIRLTTKRSGERILIRIADEGPGIPPEIRSRLFEPNFSTKTDGMGLGLAIVKKIIDDVGGSISIESSVGMGTVVSILLPLAGAAREIGSPGERAGRTS
jgi:signal transduction histidine kinase